MARLCHEDTSSVLASLFFFFFCFTGCLLQAKHRSVDKRLSTSCRTRRARHRSLRQQDLCLGRQVPQQGNPHGLCPHLWCRERLLGGGTPAGGWYFWDGCLCPHVAQGYFNGNREVALRMARRPNEASPWLSIRSYERIRLGGIWQLKWRLEN